jgi:fluoroacetyl-CoA thioesterase
MEELTIGCVAVMQWVVAAEHTARHLGSGGVEGLATPTMILWMETTAVRAVEDALGPGQSSVGTRVEVRHLGATPLGMQVEVRAELVEVDGRRLVFRVTAEDEQERVGEGIHERVVIDAARFAARLAAKRGK